MILLFQISGVSWFMDLLFVLVSVSVDSFISPCLGAGSQFSSLGITIKIKMTADENLAAGLRGQT